MSAFFRSLPARTWTHAGAPAASGRALLYTRIRLDCSTLSHRSRTAAFSTSFPAASPIEKKSLSKKITLPKDPYLLSEKVLKFSRNGKLDDAITLVLEAPKSRQNEVVWNHLIQESSRLGKTTQSWKLLNDMKKRGFEPNDRTFTILLNALAINSSSPNNVSRAKALYQQMQDSEDTPPTLTHTNALLKVCARNNDHEALLNVYNSMPTTGPNAPDVVTFNLLINSLARMGGDKGFEQAWKIWEDCLGAKAQRPDHIDLDQALVDAMLLACREARSSAYAKRGLRLVESLYGLEPSTPATQKSASKPGSKALEDMTATERAISPSKGLGLGAILRKDTIQPRTVELLLSICSKLKDYSMAQHYMDLIRQTYPDFKLDSQLLSTLMHMQVLNKQYEDAIKTWDDINVQGLQHTPSTFQQGLDAALKARNWEKTLEMYSTMRELIDKNKNKNMDHRRPINPIVHKQDAWSLVSVLKCALKTKHQAEALQILRESRWTSVVSSPQYPRANADLATLATRIYKSALKPVKGETSAPADVARLERELEKAEELENRLDAALAQHDERSALRDSGRSDRLATRRISTPSGFVPTSISNERTDKRVPRISGSGQRMDRDGGEPWKKQEGRTGRSNMNRTAGAIVNRDHGKEYSKSSSKARDRRAPKQLEDAFTPTQTFRRDVF
ncbi:hypothetical protein BGZ72_002210 [Mortierella alpina]|nr:hypothetical protein BGZ72_002210 [Mortierella alpina]